MLGARYLRVFILTPTSVDRADSMEAADAALRPIADYAALKGLIVVIEPQTNNHSADGDYLARLAEKMNHPSVRLMPDFGKMRATNLDAGLRAMMPYTELVSAKTLEFSDEGLSCEFDYPALMQTVLEAGFCGIVAIEYEGEQLGPVEGVRATQLLLNKLQNRILS
jgi:sugar phosphate isomerase/epimerase